MTEPAPLDRTAEEPPSRLQVEPREDVRVEVQYAVAARGLSVPRRLAAWAATAVRLRHTRAELVLRVVGTAESRTLNERWRGGRGATNVLAFPCTPPPHPPIPLLGDVLICAPVAQHEARTWGGGIERHWAYLVVHGTLHLLGYDHQQPRAARSMHTAEARVLRRFGWRHPHPA